MYLNGFLYLVSCAKQKNATLEHHCFAFTTAFLYACVMGWSWFAGIIRGLFFVAHFRSNPTKPKTGDIFP